MRINFLNAKANTYEEYLAMRKDLLIQDEKSWFDFNAQPTEAEEKLNALMSEQRNILIQGYMKYNLPFAPEEPFYEMKELIEQNSLFTVLKEMPKGGMLHLHTSSAVDVKWILDTIQLGDKIGLPNAYVFIKELAPAANYVDRQLAFFNNPPKGFIGVTEMLKDKAFYNQMVDLLTFSTARIENVSYIWDEFNTIFARTSELLKNSTFYFLYYSKAFCMLVDDNIEYLELRAGFGAFTETSDKMPAYAADVRLLDDYDEDLIQNGINLKDTLFLTILKQAETCAKEYAKQKEKEFNLKVILCGNRRKNDMEQAYDKMLRANDYKNMPEFTDFIIGFDLVGEEDRGERTQDYAQFIIESGLDDKLDFYFHDGESNWSFDNNVIDAYLLSSKRIGHGFNLSYLPDLIERVKSTNTQKIAPLALEICPISNQLLRYTSDLRAHPAYQLLKRGVQCVIASDDPQIFQNHGLSYDFWEIYVAFNFDIMQIKALVYNSIIYSAMNDYDKTIALSRLDTQWLEFIGTATAILESLK